MLSVTPASLVASDVSCGTVLKGHCLRGVEARFQPLSAPLLDRVNAVVPLQSETGSSIARLGEPNGVQRSDSHPARPTVQHEPKHPILRAILSDAQIEPAAIGVHAGPLCSVHPKRGEPADCSRHFSPQSCPHSSCGLWRTAVNV